MGVEFDAHHPIAGSKCRSRQIDCKMLRIASRLRRSLHHRRIHNGTRLVVPSLERHHRFVGNHRFETDDAGFRIRAEFDLEPQWRRQAFDGIGNDATQLPFARRRR